MSRKRGNGDGSVYTRGKRLWISYFDENGERQRRSAGTTDRRLADRILREQTERVAKIRAGLIDPRAERLVESGRRPIRELVDAFADKLNAKGRTPAYVARTKREVLDYCEAVNAGSLGDITAEQAAGYLETLRKAGQAARTRQCRITSVKGFTRWAWRGGLIAADPLAGVKRPNPETDRRHRRRMLLVEEWHRLDAATRAAPDFRGMSGQERALVYAVALQTGLRAGELATLTKASLHLGGERPFIVVEAGGTKNRRVARQFVRRELADQLAEHAARKAPGAKLFRFPDQSKLASMLRDDLKRARDAWLDEAKHDAHEAAERRDSDFLSPKDADGRVIDFHALRHTCGAWAALGGASPKAIQSLMRHSTIMLTLDTYGHLLPDEAAETIERMPGFDARIREAAIGTIGADCDSSVHNRGTAGRHAVRADANEMNTDDSGAVVASIGGDSTSSESVRCDANRNANSPARIRTGDRAIMSRVL